MTKIAAYEVLDNLLLKIDMPAIMVVGPDIGYKDSSLTYYLHKAYEKNGHVCIADKPDKIEMCKEDIKHLVENPHIILTYNFDFIPSDARELEKNIKEEFNLISYHDTIAFISDEKEEIKKAINSGYTVLSKGGSLVFMTVGKNAELRVYDHSIANGILEDLLLEDDRFKADIFDIEDKYLVRVNNIDDPFKLIFVGGTTRCTRKNSKDFSFFEPYHNCKKMLVATKL